MRLAMTIVDAAISDQGAIRDICLAAFDAVEAETVAELAVALLEEAPAPPSIHLVAEIEGRLVGQVTFTPVCRTDTGERIGAILAPLAVSPDQQGRGIGSALVREGLCREARGEGGLVFVYGDPAYYGRFGFERETARAFMPPHPLSQPEGWLAVALEGADLPDEAPVSIECVAALSRPELW